MTATTLVDDPEFVAFCRCWERDGRCPIGFADWLRDRALAGQGDAAQWAAEQPDREFAGDRGGVRPFDGYPWCSAAGSDSRSAVPGDVEKSIREITNVDPTGLSPVFTSYRGRVALFLDGWAAARRPNRPQPETKSCGRCGGSGVTYSGGGYDSNDCPACGGKGRITDPAATAQPRWAIG